MLKDFISVPKELMDNIIKNQESIIIDLKKIV